MSRLGAFAAARLPLAVFVAAISAAGCDGRRPPEVDGDATTAATAAAGSLMGPLEPSVNRPGRDLSDHGLPVSSAADCARRCADDPRCVAMSFADPAEGSKDGLCFLKDKVPEPASSAGITSAVKRVGRRDEAAASAPVR